MSICRQKLDGQAWSEFDRCGDWLVREIRFCFQPTHLPMLKALEMKPTCIIQFFVPAYRHYDRYYKTFQNNMILADLQTVKLQISDNSISIGNLN